MGATDSMLQDLQGEIERRTALKDGLAQAAREAGRDMTDDEMQLYQDTTKQIDSTLGRLNIIAEGQRVSVESRRRLAEISDQMRGDREPRGGGTVEYRSVGAYVADMYFAALGDTDAMQRQQFFQRAAAHQTTADNPGLLPEQIVQPLVNFIEVARPLTNSLGPTDLGGGAWSYARVTQHTLVAKQAGEKTELASRKMTVTKTPLGADTFGGYVNVSKQDINRSSPAILDMIINDLAQQYAIETEEETADVLWAAATAGPIIPTGPATGAVVANAIWGAAGQVFAATKGQGQTVVAVSPDMLGLIGPIFPPINPTNAYSSGFQTPNTQGDVGSIAGLTVIMSAGLDTGQILVYSTAAAKTFEYVYGNLQVVEPSVWGVQVGYAGDFDAVVIEPAGIVKVTKTP
jgi:hypothetical protein